MRSSRELLTLNVGLTQELSWALFARMTATNMPSNISISQDPPGIIISWDDGIKQTLSFQYLRQKCPCAQCKGERLPLEPRPLQLPVVKSLAPGAIVAKDMFKIGTYAIGFAWGDGHDTGIYTYDYLRELVQFQIEQAENTAKTT